MEQTNLPTQDVQIPEGTDALISEIMGAENQVPATSKSTNLSVEKPADPKANPFLEIKWNDQIKRFDLTKDLDKVQSYAQKGYDYEQKIGNVRKMADEYGKKLSVFGDEARFNELSQIDAFTKANPDFFQEIQAAYQRRMGLAATPTDPAAGNPALPDLSAHPVVNQLMQKVQGLENTIQQKDVDQGMVELDQNIANLRKTHDYINWDQKDDFGFNKEHQILKAVAEKGMTPEEAALMLYGKEMIEHAKKTSAKETEDRFKDNFRKTKTLSGFYNSSSTPRAKMDVTKSSYDDIGKQIMKDFGIGD